MKKLLMLCFAAFMLALLGCGGSGGYVDPPPSTDILLKPGDRGVDFGEVVQYYLTNSEQVSHVVWSCSDGTITQDGLYTAPQYLGAFTVSVDYTLEGVRQTQTTNVTITYFPEVYPLPRFTYTPESPRIGELVTFDASTSVNREFPDEPLEFRWRIGNANIWSDWSSSPIATKRYERATSTPAVLEVRTARRVVGRTSTYVTVVE